MEKERDRNIIDERREHLEKAITEFRNIKKQQLVTKTKKSMVQFCPRIGYMQHDGECWHDTIQQIFCFSDKTKKMFKINYLIYWPTK